MRILIIGSEGYIGKNLNLAHKNNGDDVFLLSSQNKTGIDHDLGIFISDVDIPVNTDIVYFLSQSPFYRDVPEKFSHLLSVNCVSALQAAEASRKSGVKTFIYASTGNVYEDSYFPLSEKSPTRSDNFYASSKIIAEDTLNLYRPYFNIVCTRIFGVYGPAQKDKLIPTLIHRVRSNSSISIDKTDINDLDMGGLKISLIYIDDLIESLIKISQLDSPPKIVNIAGNEVLSIRNIVEQISLNIDIPVNFNITEKIRSSNLIADNSLLTSLVDIKFKSFSDGIKTILKEDKC